MSLHTARQQTLQQAFAEIWNRDAAAYDKLNALREYINQYCAGVEAYLEDEWNVYAPGQTWIEYRLRSLKTLEETEVWGADVYLNKQDSKGVWHLLDYQETQVFFNHPDCLIPFLTQHATV